MRPVLLFDVGVVVAVARPTPGEVNLLLQAVGKQLPVDELRTVVRIQAAEGKGQTALDGAQGGQHPFLGLAQDGLLLTPAGGQIR